jgi:hypothetical protein
MEHPRSVLEFGKDTLQHPHWALVERVAASQHFQSSARLKDFLLYVASCSLRGAPEEVTEHFIGIKVFHRSPGYNSAEDSIVRTHARLLRQKLADYFQNEGSREETIIEIPKGHYLPVFRPRHPVPLSQSAPTTPDGDFDTPKGKETGQRPQFLFLVTAAVLFCVASVGWWGSRKWSSLRAHPEAVPSVVEQFWQPFFAESSSLVIYSNALFVGNSTDGLRYAPNGAEANPAVAKNYVDTYTGVGELNSVYELTRLFDDHHASFTLKRSLLVTWDEAKQRNLIFIGSVAENPALRVMPNTMDFTLTAGHGFSGIVNRTPRAGELPLYSRPEHPLTKDYAVVALLPGLEPGRRTLVFSGLMTFGTQAAVEFACRPEGLEQLVHAAADPGGTFRPFEAVIETTLGGDVPLRSRLVAIHVH